MKIAVEALAGSLESNDVLVRVSPGAGNLEVTVESIVLRQFGQAIEEAVRQTADNFGVRDAVIHLVDKGAVDWTVRARVETALKRAGGAEV